MTQEKQKLTLDSIDFLNYKYEQTKEIEFERNVEGNILLFSCNINKFFSKTKIKNLINEYIENMESIKFLSSTESFKEVQNLYFVFLVIKHFSDIEFPNEISKQLDVIGKLIDNDLFVEIYNNFDSEQIEEINKELIKRLEVFDENISKLDNGDFSVEKFSDLFKQE